MATAILLVCPIVLTSIVAWLFRRRLVRSAFPLSSAKGNLEVRDPAFFDHPARNPRLAARPLYPGIGHETHVGLLEDRPHARGHHVYLGGDLRRLLKAHRTAKIARDPLARPRDRFFGNNAKPAR